MHDRYRMSCCSIFHSAISFTLFPGPDALFLHAAFLCIVLTPSSRRRHVSCRNGGLQCARRVRMGPASVAMGTAAPMHDEGMRGCEFANATHAENQSRDPVLNTGSSLCSLPSPSRQFCRSLCTSLLFFNKMPVARDRVTCRSQWLPNQQLRA